MNGSSINQRLSRLVGAALTLGVIALPVFLTGCEQQQPSASAQADTRAQSLPAVSMQIGNRTFTIEVAATVDQQELGLMYRDSMPADRGMIFVFPEEEPRSFWMKNTHIPLDIVYTDRAGKIVSIQSMKPLDLTGINSVKPAMYAIELNVNAATAAGLKVGDTIKIPDFATATKTPGTTGNVSPATTTKP